MGAIADEIANYSAGMASVCHQIALNVCLVKGIRATQPKQVRFYAKDMASAMDRYAAELSETIKFAFDRASAVHNRRRLKDARPILSVLASGPVSGLCVEEILEKIISKLPNYPKASLQPYLDELTQEIYGNIVRHGTDGRYRFSEPIYQTFAKATISETDGRSEPRLPGREQRPSRTRIEADRLLLDSMWQSSSSLELVALRSLVNQINVKPAGWTLAPADRDALLNTMDWLQVQTPTKFEFLPVASQDPVAEENSGE